VIIITSRVVTGMLAQSHIIPSRNHRSQSTYRLIDSDISTPASKWEQYKKSRTSWGINVLGSFLVEIEATDGTVGFATGFGGEFDCSRDSDHRLPDWEPQGRPAMVC
jgi:hypothetical protein